MEQRRFDAAVSILDDAYRLLNGLAQGEDTEHAKAAVAAMQSRVSTNNHHTGEYMASSNGGQLLCVLHALHAILHLFNVHAACRS